MSGLDPGRHLKNKDAAPAFEPVVLRGQGVESIENLVLEGGGVKGSAYVGVVKALSENGTLQNLKRVAGSSAGGIAALMIGLGMTAKEIEAEMGSLDFKKFQDGPEQYWADFLGLKFTKDPAKKFEDIVRIMTSEKKGIYKGDFFTSWAEKLIERKLGKPNATFKDLHEQMEKGNRELKDMVFTGSVMGGAKKPGSICYFRYDESDPTFNDMPISKAVRITMSFPGAFEMVEHEINGQKVFFADGGVVNNFPMEIFDDKRYMAQDSVRTDRGKNPRTLGFKIDSAEEIAAVEKVHASVYQWAIDHKKIKKGELITKDLLKKWEPAILKDKVINEEQFKVVMNSHYDIKGVKGFIGSMVGAITDDLGKLDAYKGRAYQIHDKGVGTLDFDMKPEQKEALVVSGVAAAESFYQQLDAERRSAYYNAEKFSHKLSELSDRLNQALVNHDIAQAAICNRLIQDELNFLKEDKKSLEEEKAEFERLAPEDHERLNEWTVNLQNVDVMIKASESFIQKMNTGISHVFPNFSASKEAKQAVLEYSKQVNSSGLIEKKEKEERAKGFLVSIENNVALLKKEIDQAKSFKSKLDKELMGFVGDNLVVIKDVLLGDEAKRLPLASDFYAASKSIIDKKGRILKIQAELDGFNLAEHTPEEHKTLIERKETLGQQLLEEMKSFSNRADHDKSLSKDKQEIIKSFFNELCQSDVPEVSVASVARFANSKVNDFKNQSEAVDKRIKEHESNLNKFAALHTNYQNKEVRTQFFCDLVDLNNALKNEIKATQFTVRDWMRYGVECFLGPEMAATLGLGNAATQKFVRGEKAQKLQAIVGETYKIYVDAQVDSSQADFKILGHLKNAILKVEQYAGAGLIESLMQRKLDFGLKVPVVPIVAPSQAPDVSVSRRSVQSPEPSQSVVREEDSKLSSEEPSHAPSEGVGSSRESSVSSQEKVESSEPSQSLMSKKDSPPSSAAPSRESSVSSDEHKEHLENQSKKVPGKPIVLGTMYKQSQEKEESEKEKTVQKKDTPKPKPEKPA